MLLLVSCGAKTLEDLASDSSETSRISEPNRLAERNMAQGAKQLAEHLYEIGDLMQETAVPECFRSPHLRAKCKFFFERIRLAFDSRAWQEQTYWEARLAEAER